MVNKYIHSYCTGCGKLWITDGIWKLTFPHCMFPTTMKVDLNVNFPSVCPEEPQSGQAFCEKHCSIATREGIPTKLNLFLNHCKLNVEKVSIYILYITTQGLATYVHHVTTFLLLECADVTEEMIDRTLQSCNVNEAEDMIPSTAETQG